jgi:hypothetical protein
MRPKRVLFGSCVAPAGDCAHLMLGGARVQPPHTYVPWVTVNGVPIYTDSDNLLTYICKAYTGTPPAACAGL